MKKVGGIILAIVAFAIAKVAVRSGIDFAQQKSVTSTSVESRLESNEITSPTANAMKEYFQAEYHQWTDHIAEIIVTAPAKTSYSSTVSVLPERFRQGHTPSKSRQRQTVRWLRLHSGMPKSLELFLQRARKRAADFCFEGLKPKTARELSKAIISEIGLTTPLLLRAAHEGQLRPTVRSPQLSDEDARSLIAELRRQGLSTTELEELSNGKADQEDVVTKCSMTSGLYAAITAFRRNVGTCYCRFVTE